MTADIAVDSTSKEEVRAPPPAGGSFVTAFLGRAQDIRAETDLLLLDADPWRATKT